MSWKSDPGKDEWYDDDLDDPQEQDWTDDDEPEDAFACPACGEEVWEEAERCPHCGEWLTSASRRSRPAAGRTGVALLLIGLMLLAGMTAIVCSR
jgi:predicted RNA-binding Zn-ribbon protein involved in translation (DUF1610 family)